MAKSSISADVKAANSKLAQFLRRKEEEEMVLQIGRRKPKELKEERRMPGGRARWAAQPDFKVPTCMVDRPRTSTGATSFHFSYISISKQAVPTINGKPVEGPFGMLRQAALEHSKYIERDGAAEVSSGAHHAGYIERPAAVESVDPSALIEEAIERTISSIINETPTGEEATVLGLRDVVPDGIPSVFSNISDDPFERQEYWRAVERCERTPKSHSIILDPETSPRWWSALPSTEQLDADFKSHALTVAEKYRQWASEPAPENGDKEPFRVDPLRVSAERAGKLIKQAMSMPGFDNSLPPLDFKSGRGGRVQIRFVAELPHEVTPEDRALIVQNFCDRLASLETRIDSDGTVRKVGMMYTAVIHAPDAHNDSRNYHLHIVAHDRPARYLEEHGMWDFEFEEHFNVKGMDRVRFPYRQNKVGEIARAGNGADYQRSGRNFVPAMRSDFSKITNAVLKARGIERRYDPRKYTEMGIDRTPTEHLGTKAAALEAIGVPTVVGQLNAIAIWDDAERAIERQARQSEAKRKAAQQKLVELAKEATAAAPSIPALAELRSLMAERSRLIEDLAEDRRSIMAFDHMEAKAKSRAIRTRQTCLQFLADIENDKADHSTRVMKFAIQARWKDAQAHIAKIDAALEPHRPTLAAAAREIERREARVAAIDIALKPLQATIQRHLEVGAPAAARTPSPQSTSPQIEDAKSSIPEAKKSPQKDEKPGLSDEPKVAPPEAAQPLDTEGPASAAKPGRKGSKQALPSDQNVEPRVDDHEAEPVASLQPTTIEGLPITKGTIAPPAVDEQSHSSDGPSHTPEGLEPLRPAPTPQPSTAEPETVIPDISRNDGGTASAEAPGDRAQDPAPDKQPRPDADKQASTPSKRVDADTPADTDEAATTDPANAPKIDRRRKVEEPALFDLPAQEPPIKPGTTKAEYADWDALFKRITKERIPIKAEPQKGGAVKYTVPSLSDEERALLNAKRFARRTPSRLAGIHDRQMWEIKRLVRWISEHGQDPAKLIIEDRTAKLGQVRDAVRTLMRNWGRHPDVVAAVKAENNRRIEMNKMQSAPATEKPLRDDLPTGLSREELLAEAAAKYPAPDQVYTPLVSEFTRLLRELAPKEDLQAAADKIHANADAREDVNRHTVELATAYSKYVDGVDLRDAYRDRGGKGGLG